MLILFLGLDKTIGHFRVPKTLTFKMRLGTQPFLWKWVLFAWEWKIISISKAEHLPSFWNRGPGAISLRMQLSLLKGTRRDGSISPHVRECGSLLVEAGILGFGIRNTSQGFRNPTKDWNQESKFHWQRLESSSWNPVCKNVLDFQWGYTFKLIERALRIQLFRERLSEKVHATIPKGIVGSFESTVLQKIWKIGTRGHGRMFVSAKGKQQKQVLQLQSQEQCIDHIPYYLSGLSPAHFFRQPFSK